MASRAVKVGYVLDGLSVSAWWMRFDSDVNGHTASEVHARYRANSVRQRELLKHVFYTVIASGGRSRDAQMCRVVSRSWAMLTTLQSHQLHGLPEGLMMCLMG